MPKMRGFKPEIWTDDKFVQLSPLARLLFMGSWNYACDNGHLEDKPAQLKMRILPADQCDVSELLDEIVEQGMVIREDGLITIPNLPLHQRLDKRYFTTCEHCEPVVPTTGTRSAHDGDTSGARGAHALKEGRKEGERKGEEGESRAKRATQLPDDFRPSEAHATLATELAVDLRAEWAQFVDHHRAKGSTFKDWNAALRTWIRNADKYRKGPRPVVAVITPDQLPPVENTWMRRRS